MDTKFCKNCQLDKPVSEYWKWKNAKDGLQRLCIECQKKIDKNRREVRKKEPALIHRDSKTCRMCNQTKPISQFGKRTQLADKHLSYCKPCWRAYVAKAKKKMVQ